MAQPHPAAGERKGLSFIRRFPGPSIPGRLLSRPAHPLLFAAYPALFLYAHNQADFAPDVLLLPVLASLGLAAGLWALFGLLLGDREKGALPATLSLVFFFSHGHLHNLIGEIRWDLPLFGIGPNRLIALAYLLSVIPVVLLLRRARGGIQGWTRFANLAGAILVVIAAVSILAGGGAGRVDRAPVGSAPESAWGPADSVWQTRGETAGSSSISHSTDSTALPHIVYLILDGYARADLLQEVYGFDNTPFLERLRERGFQVVGESRANYCQTALSLASSLGMSYLDDVADRLGPESRNRQELYWRIKQPEAVRLLRPLGYRFAAFASGYYPTEARDADLFLSPEPIMSEFRSAFLRTTPVPEFLTALGRKTEHDRHRERIRFALDRLPGVVAHPRPHFVFAHLLVPHPPFVFDREGNPVDPLPYYTIEDGDHLIRSGRFTVEEYRRMYLDQLQYLNGELDRLLSEMEAKSSRPLVLILQSDHGPASLLHWTGPTRTDIRERLSNFLAVRVPEECRAPDRMPTPAAVTEPAGTIGSGLSGSEVLPPGATPANLFRHLYNLCFGAQLEILDDRSYYSEYFRPYDLEDVTDQLQAGSGGP